MTKVLANDPGALHLVQADTYGLYRELKITWSSGKEKPRAGGAELVLRSGKRAVVSDPTITVLARNIGYTVKFHFVIPSASLPPGADRMASAFGNSVLGPVARQVSNALSVPVLAAQGDGISGSFESTVQASPVKVVPHDPELEAVRTERLKEALITENVEALERKIAEAGNEIKGDVCVDPAIQDTKDWMKRMKDVLSRTSELEKSGVSQKELDASPAYRELKATHASLMAETAKISAELTEAEARAGAARARNGGGDVKSEGVDVAMAQMQIDKDKRALKDRLAALRDCHEHPTAPTAIKAKTEDAAAHRRVSGAIDAVDLQVDIDSEIRTIAAVVNTGAALGLEGLGSALTGIAGEIEDGLLIKSMEAAVKSLEKCVVRCDPCSASSPITLPATSNAAQSGRAQTYTPGPVPRAGSRPAAQVCKPVSTVEVWYHHASSTTECAPLGCSTLEQYMQFSGVGTLKYVPGTQFGGIVKGAGYEGTGTVQFGRFDHNEDWPSAICTAGAGMKSTETGSATMTIAGRFGVGDTFTGTGARSRLVPEVSEVEIVIQGDFAHQVRHERCATGDYSFDAPASYQCTFEKVDLLRGGRFFTGPQNGPDGAVGFCELWVH